MVSGRFDRVNSWLNEFTEAELDTLPGLLLVAGLSCSLLGDYEGAAVHLRRSERVDPQGRTDLIPPVALREAFGVVPVTEATEALVRAPGYWTVIGQFTQAFSANMRGDIAATEAACLGLAAFAEDAPLINIWRLTLLAFAYQVQGRDMEGLNQIMTAGVVADESGLSRSPMTVVLDGSRSILASHMGRGQEAKDLMLSCVRKLGRLTGDAPWVHFSIHLTLMEAACRLGEMALGKSSYNECMRLNALFPENPLGVAAVARVADRYNLASASEESLSAAEFRILRQLGSFYTVPQIAEKLQLSPNTLRSQIQSVYRKLGVHSRAEAVELGRRYEWID